MFKRVPQEIKNEVLAKVRAGGSVKDVADQYGISTKTIYSWLSAEITPDGISQLKYNKVMRENEELKRIIGVLTLDLSRGKKGRPN
jgi:transposase-like protein